MKSALRLFILLLGWAAFRPPTAQGQACATALVTLDYGTRTTGENWANRANGGVPNPASFTKAFTTYTTSDNGSTLAVGPLNGTTLVWSATEPNKTTANSTVTYTFSRAVSNFSVRVRDIDANLVAPLGPALGHGFTDEVTFTGANGTTPVVPTLTKANQVSTFVVVAGNVATGSEVAGNTDSPVDGTVTATFASPITSLTLRYRNVTSAATLDLQSVGIDQMSWCRIAPTANPVTTGPVASTVGQANIASLSGAADGTPTYFVTTLPAEGTLLYNSTGTTYAAVATSTALTAAQAASLRYAPSATYTGTSTTFAYQVRDDASQVSSIATYPKLWRPHSRRKLENPRG
jgi:hypothetical protein